MAAKCYLFAAIFLYLLSYARGVRDIIPGAEHIKPFVRVCEGFPHPEGINSADSSISYNFVVKTYQNCTHVIGSVILTNLVGDVDLSFLNSIVEIGGSLIILNLKNVSRVSFRNLSVIRGHVPYAISPSEKVSLYIAHNSVPDGKSGIISLGSLTSVIKHSIRVSNNRGFCHLNNVKWDQLLEDKKKQKLFFRKSDNCRAKAKCSPACPMIKGKQFCFGSKTDMCQVVSNCTACSPMRCHWDAKVRTDRCCHEECAGGCFNSANKKSCFSCRNFRLDSECRNTCPPRNVYDVESMRHVPNPKFRFTLGNLCVKKCPKHFLEDDTSCVKQCMPGKTYPSPDKMKCLPCTGNKCDKVCQEKKLTEKLIKKKPDFKKFPHAYEGGKFRFTPRSIFLALKNCTVYDGSIIVSLASSRPIGKLDEHIRPEDFQNLKNLKRLNGELHLILRMYPTITNFTFLSNLESISGSADASVVFAMSDAVTFLGLRRLKTFTVKNVQISHMPKLCYMEHFKARLGSAVLRTIPGTFRSEKECVAEGKVCDKSCAPDMGCWGPGRFMCVKCRNKEADGQCVSKCEDTAGFFTIPGNDTCGKCHPQCKSSCSGPLPTQCVGGCKVAQDGKKCVAKCLLIQYLDERRICRPCSEVCFAFGDSKSKVYERKDPACLGPESRRSKKGCTMCSVVFLQRDRTQKMCASKCPKSGFFERLLNYEDVRKNPGLLSTDDVNLRRTMACKPCDPACKTCSGPVPEMCHECNAGFFKTKMNTASTTNTCSKTCGRNYYADGLLCLPCNKMCRKGCSGPRPNDCFSCEKFRIYSDKKRTNWTCASGCPVGKNLTERDADSGDMLCVSVLSSRGNRGLVIGLCVGLFIVIIVIAAVIYVCIQRRRAKLLRDRDILRARYTRQIQEDMPAINSTDYEPNAGQLRMIGSKYLTKGMEIGSGAFGTVFKGTWKPPKEKFSDVEITIDVAIKELKESGNLTTTKEFLDEAHVMASVDHHFCIQLLGVCLTSHMQLITEFMPLGSLRDYLPKHRRELGSMQLMTWVVQIAKGMAYLESRGIVHRDLAGRNVLLQNKDQVRITDFGLAKLLDPSGDEVKEVTGRFPIRWLAVECLGDRIFSSKSDVWSFGVTCWEIFTFCAVRPYQDVTAQSLYDYLVCGERLDQPDICTLDIYMLMIKCWLLEPESRPTFNELVEELSSMASDPGRYLIIKHDSMRHQSERESAYEGSTSPRVSAILPSEKPQKPSATVMLPDPSLPHLTANIADRNSTGNYEPPEHYSEDPVLQSSSIPRVPAPPVPLAAVDEDIDVETGEFAVEDDYLLPDANDDYVPPSGSDPNRDYVNNPPLRGQTVHNPRYKSEVEPVMDDDYLAPDPLNDTRESTYSDMDAGGYLDPLITKRNNATALNNPRA